MNEAIKIELSRVEELGDRIIDQISNLREVAPIYWSDDEQAWIITGHAEVAKAFSGELPLSAARHQMLHMMLPDEEERNQLIPNILRYFPQFLIMQDGEQHARIRRLLVKSFSKKTVEAYRPAAREVIHQVLDGIHGKSEVEFVEELGRQITARNIMRMIGLEDEEFYLPKLRHWAAMGVALSTPGVSKELLKESDDAFAEMAAAFLPEIEKRRANPTDDFVSMMVHAGEGDDKLSNDELIGELILILLAGHDTTLNTMALSVRALSEHPDALDAMRNNPDNLLNALLELMRYIAMSTQQARIVAEDFEWNGHQLKAGQLVHIMTAGANRDPKVFDNPEKLDLNRDQAQNMTFGPGTHHCIGHLFAKLQLTEFFPEFLNRYERFGVVEDELQFGGGLTFRGPSKMHVRLFPK
ncbi:MAG: cytochrome P450 [Halieaceae bacterium]|nr:cytochrome P450 [Halieaceae bacterium]